MNEVNFDAEYPGSKLKFQSPDAVDRGGSWAWFWPDARKVYTADDPRPDPLCITVSPRTGYINFHEPASFSTFVPFAAKKATDKFQISILRDDWLEGNRGVHVEHVSNRLWIVCSTAPIVSKSIFLVQTTGVLAKIGVSREWPDLGALLTYLIPEGGQDVGRRKMLKKQAIMSPSQSPRRRSSTSGGATAALMRSGGGGGDKNISKRLQSKNGSTQIAAPRRSGTGWSKRRFHEGTKGKSRFLDLYDGSASSSSDGED